jgi:hypothetical protein
MFDCTMLAWLLELGAAIAVAAVGVVLWSLPPETPVVGRPPLLVGWVFIAIGVVIAVLSSAGRVGWEFQSPIRRKGAGGRAAPVPPPTPTPQTFNLPPMSAPTPPARVFTDMTAQGLAGLANQQTLTKAQVDKLLEAHKDKWLSISGVVIDVRPPQQTFVLVALGTVDGHEGMHALVTFRADFDRAEALHRGADVKVRGTIDNADRDTVYLENGEFA